MIGLKDAPMTTPAASAARASAVTVLLVDDHPLVRDGVAHLLTDGGLNVVGQASSLAEGMRLADAVRADVMVVDVSLGDGSGLDLVTTVRAKRPTMGIVVLTMHNDDETLLEALDAGASSLVLKTVALGGGLAMVRRAAAAPDAFTAIGLAEALRRRSTPGQAATSPPREIEVLERLAVGDSVGRQVGQAALHERVDGQDPHRQALRQARRPQPRQRRHGRGHAWGSSRPSPWPRPATDGRYAVRLTHTGPLACLTGRVGRARSERRRTCP